MNKKTVITVSIGIILLILFACGVIGLIMIYNNWNFMRLKSYEDKTVKLFYPTTFIQKQENVPMFSSPNTNTLGGYDLISYTTSANPYDSIQINSKDNCTKAMKSAINSESAIKFKEFPDQIKFTDSGDYKLCDFYVEVEQGNNTLGMKTRIITDPNQKKHSILIAYDKNGPFGYILNQAFNQSTIK